MDEFDGEICECYKKEGGVEKCFGLDIASLVVRVEVRLGLGEVRLRCAMKSINMFCDARNKVCHFAGTLENTFHKNSMRNKCESRTVTATGHMKE